MYRNKLRKFNSDFTRRTVGEITSSIYISISFSDQKAFVEIDKKDIQFCGAYGNPKRCVPGFTVERCILKNRERLAPKSVYADFLDSYIENE